MTIHIANQEQLQQKLAKFTSTNFHVISDFDKTLTLAYIDGKKVQSTYAVIREGGYLSEEYVRKSFALFHEYHPYEVDESLSLQEKKQKMDEWWLKHWQLMQKNGMNKSVLEDVLTKGKLQLRSGCSELLGLLNSKQIPLLIFSAGLGNIIQMCLEKQGLLYGNTHIISNFFEFDEEGKVVSIPSHFIHVFNKNEYEVKSTPYHNEVSERKNVLLLGDSLGDLGMSEGLDHDEIIRVGFLNGKLDKLELYKEKFDVVIENDSGMEYVVDLVKGIYHLPL